MIEAHELTRGYGPTTAVDGISFSVGEGEILGILGPNGADFRFRPEDAVYVCGAADAVRRFGEEFGG